METQEGDGDWLVLARIFVPRDESLFKIYYLGTELELRNFSEGCVRGRGRIERALRVFGATLQDCRSGN